MSSSLTGRVVFFNLLAFLLVALAVFAVLDRYFTRMLQQRTDHSLQTEILVITSERDPLFLSGDKAAWQETLGHFSRARGIGRSFFRLLDAEGRELAASDLSAWPSARSHRPPMERIRARPFVLETAAVNESGARILYYHDPGGLILQVGFDLGEQRAMISHTRLLVGLGLAAVLFFGALLGWQATRQALVGIRQVAAAAATIREKGELDLRAPEATGSRETDELAQTINDMLDRIQGLVTNLREVMGNIAHDIKTPVTRMRGLAEADIRNGTAPWDLPGNVIEECDLIMNMITNLLEITAAESGLASWSLETLDPAEMIHDACDLFLPLMENKNLVLSLDLAPDQTLAGDRRMVQRVIANLIDNAIKYTPEGGAIHIGLVPDETGVIMSIRDSGIGIPPGELDLIFNRFYRCDRSRGQPGNGLGLSFCRAALQVQGGSIQVESDEDRGTTFRVFLPHNPPART